MKEFIFIMLGGGAGSYLRFLISKIEFTNLNHNPIATIIVNILGAFLLGFVFKSYENKAISQVIYLLIGVGFCGGFTTFSTFSLDSILLLKNGYHLHFAMYILATIVFGFLAFFAAYKLF